MCDPAAPGVVFCGTICGGGQRDWDCSVVHATVTCPVDSDAVEDLACCAEGAVLMASLVCLFRECRWVLVPWIGQRRSDSGVRSGPVQPQYKSRMVDGV